MIGVLGHDLHCKAILGRRQPGFSIIKSLQLCIRRLTATVYYLVHKKAKKLKEILFIHTCLLSVWYKYKTHFKSYYKMCNPIILFFITSTNIGDGLIFLSKEKDWVRHNDFTLSTPIQVKITSFSPLQQAIRNLNPHSRKNSY